MSTNKLLIGIIIIASLVRFIGLWPNIPHPDEAHVQVYTYELVKNVVAKGDFNPHTYKYGSWVFYLQSLFILPVFGVNYLGNVTNTLVSSGFTSRAISFGSFVDDAVRKLEPALITAGRLQMAIFGVLSVYVLFLIGERLFNKKVGLIAALLLAVSPLHARDSHYITTDILFIFFILVSFLFMVNIIQKGRWRDYLLAGFFIGLSSTIRYLPLALLAYPIAVLLALNKEKSWFLKSLVGFSFILVGVFVGIPYLFLDPQGPTLFMQDLEKYALPWYKTSLTTFVFDFLGGRSVDVRSLFVPLDRFRPVFASWIFFNAYGFLPALASLLGVVLLLFKLFKKWLLLIIIPLFNFIYISFYIPSAYERLDLPTIPFLAIFAAYFLGILRLKKPYLLVIVSLIVFLPTSKSFSASISCRNKTTQVLSREWVEKNIPKEAEIGFVPMVSIPSSIDYVRWVQLPPEKKFSLAQAQKLGLGYAFINAGRLEYNTYPYFNAFFIPPKGIYENSYFSLILSEYQSQAKLLGTIRKPFMCDSSRIYYYKLPEKLKDQTKKIMDIGSWRVVNFDNTGNVQFTNNAGVVKYHQSSFGYTPPRLSSSTIPVEKGKTYTFSYLVKVDSKVHNRPVNVIARMDFYNATKRFFIDSIKNLWLLANQGPIQVYYEMKREVISKYSDIKFPGKTVALSNLEEVGGGWKKITVTSKAPDDASLVVLSIQPITPDELYLEIKSAELLGS